MPRQMLLYDIPDEHQRIHQYLDELRNRFAPVSADLLLEQMKEVADFGRLATQCRPTSEGMFQLDAVIGFGKQARVLFFETRKGDYLALHAFTLDSEEASVSGLRIAAKRKQDLM